MKHLLIVMAFLSASTTAADFCTEQVNRAILSVYPKAQLAPDFQDQLLGELHDSQGRSVNMQKCKVWPAHPEIAIIALKLDWPDDEWNGPGALTSDLELLLFDTQTNKLVSHMVEQDKLYSDAIYVSDIKIDTARYTLAPGNTAFGIRVVKNGSSRVTTFNFEALSLYTHQQGKLSRVLNHMFVHKVSGESDGNGNGFDDTERSIVIVGNPRSGSLAPLTVKTRVTHNKYRYKNNELTENLEKRPGRVDKLTFNGTEYPVPEALKAF